jgi:hypothetical protein
LRILWIVDIMSPCCPLSQLMIQPEYYPSQYFARIGSAVGRTAHPRLLVDAQKAPLIGISNDSIYCSIVATSSLPCMVQYRYHSTSVNFLAESVPRTHRR